MDERKLIEICLQNLSRAPDKPAGAALFERALRQIGFPVEKNTAKLIEMIDTCWGHLQKLKAENAAKTVPIAQPTAVPQAIPQAVPQAVPQPVSSPVSQAAPITPAAPATPAVRPSVPDGMLPGIEFSDENLADERLEEIGGLIVSTYKEVGGINLALVGTHRSQRFDRFFLKKPPSVPFAALEKHLVDVLSHAGHSINPTERPLTKICSDGVWEIAILREEEEWDTVPMITNLPNWAQVSAAINTSAPDRYLKMIDSFHQTSPLKPGSPLKLPYGVDMVGNTFYVDLSTGFIMLGKPGTGKSVGLKNLINAAFMLLKPELFKFYSLWDLKDGVTFQRFKGLAWVDHVFDAPDALAMETICNDLEEEKVRRGKLFVSADVENLCEYNSLPPQERNKAIKFLPASIRNGLIGFNNLAEAEGYMPWQYNLIDEVIPQVTIMGVDNFCERMGKMLREWRAAGILWGLTTQYARANLGLDPSSRVEGCSIVFNSSEPAVKLVWGEKEDRSWIKMATQLPFSGSCLIRQGGRITPVQTYFTDRDTQKGLIEQVFRPWSQRYLGNKLPFGGANSQFAPENPFSSGAALPPQAASPAISQSPVQPKIQTTSQPVPAPVGEKIEAPPQVIVKSTPQENQQAAEIAKMYANLLETQKLMGDRFSLTAAVAAVTSREVAKKNWNGGVRILKAVLDVHDPALWTALQAKAEARVESKAEVGAVGVA